VSIAKPIKRCVINLSKKGKEMTKRLSAITGEYQDQQGNQKAEWTNVGVIITGKNGKDYALLDPTVNLAGILAKQNVLAMKKGEQLSDMVMTSVFEENNQQQQQGGYQAPQQQGGYQPAPGYQQPGYKA
jgi:hypothetical protein